MQNKRGLSAIIGTLLIILLVIVAVGIVWVVVRGVIEDSSDDISFSTFTSSAQVENAYVDGTNAYVTVKRDEGEGNMLGVKVVVSDGQNSVVQEFMADEGGDLEALETGTFVVDISELSGTPTTVTIAPILEIESGESVLGSVSNTYLFSDGSDPSGGSGGDPLPGAVCGNNIIDGADVCDGTDMPVGETCETQGFDAGTLACLPTCDGYDNSSCTGGSCVDDSTELCALQLGACALSEQTCTGSAWPGCNYTLLVGTPPYEVEETSCSDGVDNDCDGLMDCDDTQCASESVCTLMLENGIISSVWPGSAPRYFDSPDFPLDDVGIAAYAGHYVLFSNHLDFGNCYQISLAGHNYDAGAPPEIPEYNMSYVGFQFPVTTPTVLLNTVTSGEVFNVYETLPACEEVRLLLNPPA